MPLGPHHWDGQIKQIQYVSDITFYALDVNMDVSYQYSSHSRRPSFGKSPRNLGNSWATNDGEVQ